MALASSPGPLPPQRRGLVLTVCKCVERSIIFLVKSMHLPCLYAEDYTNPEYRAFFERAFSNN